MNVVDLSTWLEYFADGKNAGFFAPAIEDTANLLVPVVTIYEVFNRILQQRGEDEALIAVATMSQGMVIDLVASLSIVAAKLSYDLKFPMADSIILATARANNATLWTQDDDCEGVVGARFRRKC